MGSRLKTYSFLRLSLFIYLGNVLSAGACVEEETRYLAAVREFADNVLKYGRDVYGEKHTPLFVDGLNIHTHEPVKWITPSGEKWILSNLASQQNLFRTLDALTKISGDAKYREAAVEAIQYAFRNLRTPNGLLHWGGHQAYDAGADRPCGKWIHELKAHYPYYELMWEVDPKATQRLIEAFWSGHILDWSNLDMDRHCYEMNKPLGQPWKHEYKGGPVFFQSKGRSFFNAGSDLIYAAAWLTKLSGDKEPLVWAKHLAERYVETREPKFGISYGMYTLSAGDKVAGPYDDVLRKLVPGTTDFPITAFPWYSYTNPIARKCCCGYYMASPGIALHNELLEWQSLLLVGDLIGSRGEEFSQWAFEELTACGKASYRSRDNVYVPMLTDGTKLEGYVVKQDGPLGPQGVTLQPLAAGPSDFWAYATAFRVKGGSYMWEMSRSIASGNDLGEIGQTAGDKSDVNIDTACSDPCALFGFLELYKKTKDKPFLQMAEKIGDNIVGRRFHQGFFVASNKHIYTKFDAIDSLALLYLHAALMGKTAVIGQIWPTTSFFDMPYRNKDAIIDNQIIYILTESTEPPISLQEAAAVGDVNLVSALIEEGAEVDSREDSFFKTALHRAVLSGHKEVVELLLAKGARVDLGSEFPGGTPLDYAAEKGYKEIAELLIAKGADLNARRGYPAGDTPLHSAARGGHKDVVELLIAKGAEIDAKNNDGQTPLDVAMAGGRKNVANLLIEKGATIFSIHVAASVGNVEKVAALIQKGVGVDAKDKDGRTPLQLAVSEGRIEVVEFLIEKGADVNAKDKAGYSPLHHAIWSEDEEMAKLLIEKCAGWEATDPSGYTALHWAVMMGSGELTKLLLDMGADANAKDNDGETPLDVAAHGSPRSVGELLVKEGAEVSTLHTATYVGDLEKVKSFVEKGEDINGQNARGGTPLHTAAAGGRKDVLEFLVAKHADIEAKDKREMTPLHTAASAGQKDAAEWLLSHGADANSKSKGGFTALHYAAMSGDRDVTELFLAKGCDVNEEAARGFTPLHYASMVGNKEVVELLIAKGADVNAKDNMGRSALSRAKEKGHDEIVELLLKHGAKE